MVASNLSKNGGVMPFFVIFRLVREKLLVTVALDHPVEDGSPEAATTCKDPLLESGPPGRSPPWSPSGPLCGFSNC